MLSLLFTICMIQVFGKLLFWDQRSCMKFQKSLNAVVYAFDIDRIGCG